MKPAHLMIACTLFVTGVAHAETTTVAVASNFVAAAREIIAAFEADSGHRVRLVPSSSGKHYAQIINGAPFDVFLSADEERPARLEQAGRIVPGSRFTYSIGRLTLWSTDPGYANRDCEQALREGDFRRISIANPAIAPYGVAAEQVLHHFGYDRRSLRGRLALGENASQSLQFVASGSASLGLVARAQLNTDALPPATCRWDVPTELHQPLLQQAVLIDRGGANPAAVAFIEFLRGDIARGVILGHGYALPE